MTYQDIAGRQDQLDFTIDRIRKQAEVSVATSGSVVQRLQSSDSAKNLRLIVNVVGA